jgi:VCBS repeat-containing protein
MAENNYFSHTSLDGRTFVQRIVAAGYANYLSLAENIAYHSGSANAAQVYSMWKNSAGHYANMMGDFNEAGLGVYSRNGLTYYTLDLGKSTAPVQTPPMLAHIGNQSVSTGQPLSFVISATDADGDVLIYSAAGLPIGASFSPSTRIFYWIPNDNQVGSHSGVHFEVTDGLFTASENISINVVHQGNTPPVAAGDTGTTTKNTTLTVPAPGVLGNDTDADGNALTAIKVTGPAKGSLTLNANGSYTYTPNAGYTGTDNFTYKANDGGADSNTATVTISVTATNTPPVAAGDTGSTPKNTTLTVPAPGVLGNDTDADGNALTAIKVTGPARGSLTLDANGSYTYTPNTGYTGADSFTYKANDGGADSNTATVTINVVELPPPTGGGGGSFGGFGGLGGGGTVPGPGVTTTLPYINSDGLFNLAAVVKSEDSRIALNIAKGVVARTQDDLPVRSIKIVPMDIQPTSTEEDRFIGQAYEITPDGARFSPSIALTVSYDPSDLPQNVAKDSLTLVVFDTSTSSWETIRSVHNEADSSITADIEHFSNYAVMGKIAAPSPPPPSAAAPACFALSEVSVTPAKAVPGQIVTISSKVSNTGGTAGHYEVSLKINGAVESSKEVYASAGTTETVAFAVSRSFSGRYEVDLNGLTGSFAIEQDEPVSAAVTPQTQVPAPPVSKQGVGWALAGALIGLVAIAGGVFGIVRLRRNT